MSDLSDPKLVSQDEMMCEQAIEAIPFAVMVISDDRVIEYANAAVERVLGWKPEELRGKSTVSIYRSEREFIELGEKIYSKLDTVAYVSEIYPAKHKDGRDMTCSINVGRLPDKNGKKRIVAVYEDITESVEAERELQESEEKYRNYIENTHEIIFNLTTDGKILNANKVWHKAFGYDEASLETMEISKILQPENVSEFDEIVKEAAANTPVLNREIRFSAKDGSLIIIIGNFIPRSFYGEVVSIGCFCRDVTENRRIEQEVKDKIAELEKFQQITVDRELKMIELKKKILDLERRAGVLKEQVGEDHLDEKKES